MPLLNLEQRIGRFDQVTVWIERNLAGNAGDCDLREAVGNLLPIERIGAFNGLYHRERCVIRKRCVQFDVLVEAGFVPFAKVLGRRQLVERRTRFEILRAFARWSGDLQERFSRVRPADG